MTFVISSLLLVPFLYAFSSVPDACAAPREEGWGGKSCVLSDDEKRKYCCWHEPDDDLVCQVCDVDGTNCDGPEVYAEKGPKDIVPGEGLQEPSRDSGPGEGLQEPSRDSGPKLLQKDGMVFNLPTENKIAPSEQNSSTNNNTVAKDLRVPGKIEVPNLK